MEQISSLVSFEASRFFFSSSVEQMGPCRRGPKHELLLGFFGMLLCPLDARERLCQVVLLLEPFHTPRVIQQAAVPSNPSQGIHLALGRICLPTRTPCCLHHSAGGVILNRWVQNVLLVTAHLHGKITARHQSHRIIRHPSSETNRVFKTSLQVFDHVPPCRGTSCH